MTFRLRQLRTTRLTAGQADPVFPVFASNLADPRVLQQLHYTYDPVGNITEIYDEAYEPVFFKNQQVAPRSRYVYDALYRLVEATGREGFQPPHAPTHAEAPPNAVDFPVTDQTLRNYTQRYTYDAAGNIQRMRHIAIQGDWNRRYAYAADSNRLLRTWEGDDNWNSTSATEKTTYHYDRHGSMRNLRDVAAAQYLRWDHRDMLGTLDLGGGGDAYYQYDAGKQRTRKVIVNETARGRWERIYFGGLELYRRFAGGSSQPVEEIESLHLFEGQQRMLLVEDVIVASTPLSPRPDGLTVPAQTLFRYQYGNHLGSACLELDDAAKVISYEEYHPYGTSAYRAMKNGIEVPSKRYRYTGAERDDESGLSYHMLRHYAPGLARWLTSDPIGISGGINLYLYAADNPLRYADRNGAQGVTAGFDLGESLHKTLHDSEIGKNTREFWLGVAGDVSKLATDIGKSAGDTQSRYYNSDVAINTRDFWYETEGRQRVLGGFFGTASGIAPVPVPIPEGLPPTADASARTMQFAVSSATAVVNATKMAQAIRAIPPRGPTPALAFAGPGRTLTTGGTAVIQAPPTVVAMSGKAPSGGPPMPTKGTPAGDIPRYQRYLAEKTALGKKAMSFAEWFPRSRGSRSGGKLHQQIQEALYKSEEAMEKEVRFSNRWADNASPTEVHQIGGRNVGSAKTGALGAPISRERDALRTILEEVESTKSGQDVYFWNKSAPGEPPIRCFLK